MLLAKLDEGGLGFGIGARVELALSKEIEGVVAAFRQRFAEGRKCARRLVVVASAKCGHGVIEIGVSLGGTCDEQHENDERSGRHARTLLRKGPSKGPFEPPQRSPAGRSPSALTRPKKRTLEGSF